MAFIGNSVTTQGFTPAIDYFSGNGSTVTFTLSRPVASVASIIVTVDNVVQNSGASAYTVSGNSITFSSAPLSGTNNIWVQYTSPITQTLGLTQDPSVVGDMTLTGGVYAVGDFGSGYSDGTIMDYVTGNGRITVGPSDDLTFYHGGYYSRSALMTLSYAGNSTLYNNLSVTGALTVATKLNLPTWTTGTRPASPSTGTTGFNTTTVNIEVYNGTSWQGSNVGPSYSASYLIVAGGAGGAGGSGGGGGGGAGGLLSGTSTLSSGITYSFTVGAGGAGTNADGTRGNNGSNSTGLSLTAIGGGGAGAITMSGASGGSGGGCGRDGNNAGGGAGTSGQGYAGGNTSGTAYASGSGGGGAGAVGGNGSASGGGPTDAAAGGAGGVGVSNSITGSAVYYAGGGGGSAFNISGGAGGNGGGGAGGNTTGGTSGTANLGGGGGGGRSAAGGNGGSGVVIISVPTANYTGTTTGSPTVTTSGSNTIMTFTASGSYTA